MRRGLVALLGVIIVVTAAAVYACEWGDANGDGDINVGDAVCIINYVFKGGPAPGCLEPGTVVDIDGNVYHTVTIGTQVWMLENLKVTHYRNGDDIPVVTDNAAWQGLATGAYCEYENDGGNVADYGRLYNWYAVDDSRGIAPFGWHVPSDAEWQTLVEYVGNFGDAGYRLRETGTTHWEEPNDEATNESGFTALPGGYRNNYGYYYGLHNTTYFWASTGDGFSAGYSLFVNQGPEVELGFRGYTFGVSIRCIKD